ncbi:MAG: serine hydrolase domain-containing protein, partial [Ekhidna sp.]
PPQNHNTPKIKFRNLSKYLDTYLQGMAENGLFSGSILIARDDKVHYDKSFGDVGKGDQIKIASVSKLFTSIAIVQLVQQGHISINDPISKYVKEYPSDISQQVTIKHLLLHTSGIELDDNRNFVNKSRFATSLEELINLQVNYLDSLNEGRRMNFKPLENYDYSNEGYDLLGYIVEVVSGRSFDEFLWHNIFKKLDLRNTGFDVANAVQGLSHYKDLKYNYVPGKLFNTEQFDFNYPSPSGGIYSTTSDLFKFYKAIQKSKLFEGEWMNVLLAESVSTGEDSKYGFGIMKRSEQGYRVVGHHGSLPGANAAVYYLTDPKIYIVILSNREDQAMRLFSHLLRRVSFKT